MGWVMFQGGDPEFPVWLGPLTSTAVAAAADDGASVFITRDYRWVNTTAATDPTSGRIKVNNLDPALATEAYVSAYDLGGTAYLTLLSLTTGDLFAVYISGDVTTRIEYKLTGPVVNNTTWLTVPVSLGANHGFASGTPGNNTPVKVTVQTTGSAPPPTITVPDEVWIGPTEPTDPNVELWYDTDEVVPYGRQVVENKGTVTSYTLGLADENKVLWFQASTAIALNVPAYATTPFPLGFRVDVVQTGAGRLTVSASGASIVATPSQTLRGQGSTASILNLTTNNWLVTGDLG
jgi:hypothetical protein